VLVDGFLAPTWSWRNIPELWSGKHKTTGFKGQGPGKVDVTVSD